MNKIFNPLENIDKFILICVGLLGILSLTMLESTVYEDGFVLARPVLIQAIAYLLGFGVLLFIQNLDYRFFIGLEKILYALSVLFLLTVYIPGLGQENYGSRAWINLGITTLQPSEFVKIPFVLIMAGYLSEHRDELTRFTGVFKAFLVAAPIIAVVLKEDLGSALVYIVMWIFMVFFAGIDYKLFFQCALACLAAVPIVYKFLDDYQKERIEAFLSVVVEELGFLGGTLTILVYAFLLIRFTRIIRDSVDLYGALIVIGFLGMFLFQIFENIAMTMGLMPVTGITLPFLSGGGTSVIASMIAVGIIVNVGVNSKAINF